MKFMAWWLYCIARLLSVAYSLPFLTPKLFCWLSYFNVPSPVFECIFIVFPPSVDSLFFFPNCPQNYILPPCFWWFSSMELVTLRSSMPLIVIEFINAFPTNFLFLQPKSFFFFSSFFFSIFLFFMPLFLPKPPFRVFNLVGLP